MLKADQDDWFPAISDCALCWLRSDSDRWASYKVVDFKYHVLSLIVSQIVIYYKRIYPALIFANNFLTLKIVFSHFALLSSHKPTSCRTTNRMATSESGGRREPVSITMFKVFGDPMITDWHHSLSNIPSKFQGLER